MLEVENLDVRYGEARALGGVSLAVAEKSLFAVIGSNGAGKTSLIRAIAGMLRPSAGRIRFAGIDITRADSSQTCELGIGQVAEGRQVFPTLTVEENLTLAGALRRARANRRRNLDRGYAMFPRLAERRRQAAGTLSGGEQQMLAIARCLMGEPRLIIFDEPSLGLSPLMVEMVFDTIRALREQGLTILLVEQNVAESLDVADAAAVLENGEVALAGTAAELAANDEVRRAYLGIA
ncbi:MAG: ABC transporter ATP-binding protein [Rhodospirillaceae bacterium]|nr:ABC transporter ATP-binding protein [Rhodospirillaceae bacterium]